MLSKEISPEAIRGDQKLLQEITLKKSSFRDSRTACLWFQYMDMIDILRQFIKAERTGNWGLHLKAIKDMLPFFAAAGHNLYMKSGYIYLQQITELQETTSEVYQHFTMGNHVVRRKKKFWARLSTDLVIEQVLMRSIKSVGGLPHIVFDGYKNGPTTKDITLARRTKGVVGTRVIFDGRTTFKSKKNYFCQIKRTNKIL